MSVAAKLLSTNTTYLKNVAWFRNQLKPASPNRAELQVLFKSKHFVVVNKPHDLVMYDFNKESSNTPSLFQLMREKFPFHFDPRIKGGFHVLHRLDAVTSGCLCVPLNAHAQADAIKAFQRGRVKKRYLALVYGTVERPESPDGFAEIRMPIGDDLRNLGHAMCTPVDPDGAGPVGYCSKPQEAVTRFKVIEHGSYKGRECTKVLCELETGRRHQIRVHLSRIGHPIVGDLTYGIGDYDSFRTMLHACKFEMTVRYRDKVFESVKASAQDPFTSELDPDWRPNKPN